MKRLRNSTCLPDATVKRVIDWIADELGISGFDVECRKLGGGKGIAGRAYRSGCLNYHGNRRPFVTLRIGQSWPYVFEPYQYRHHKGKRYVFADATEGLVYLAAHELRHLWQAASHSDKRKSKPLARFHGSKGKFSEVDTESFAIHTLRKWRAHQRCAPASVVNNR